MPFIPILLVTGLFGAGGYFASSAGDAIEKSAKYAAGGLVIYIILKKSKVI
tara:strand:- start:3441 stop:3593 length:153 start_codon:yes stop_codon:yes gene_type:complete